MFTEELVRKLFEASESLNDASLHESEETLKRLETVEILLAQVEQTPPQPLKDTLSLLMNVLLSKSISGNDNMDVKASAVFSITELLRIFAPDAPYSDDQMKEIFLMTVPVLDNLSLTEGRAFEKAVLVLDVMAKIRTVLILLDLVFECGDALVVQMFRQFFKNIRSDHPKTVFPCMESIMTLVIEDSDAISPYLLSVLLSSVRKENQVTSPMALKLGENIFTVCAKKLQKHIVEAVRKGTINVDDYAEIVKTIYLKESSGVELNSNNDEPKKNPEKNEPAQDNGQVKAISNDAENKDASESLQSDGPTCGLLVPEVIEPVSLEEEKSKDEPDSVPQKTLAKRSSPSIEEDEGNLKRARSIPTDQEISESETEGGSRRITVTFRPPKKDDNNSLGSRGLKRRSSPKIVEQGSSKRANTSVVASGSESENEPSSLIDTWTSYRQRNLGLRKPIEQSKVGFLLFGGDLNESKGQPRRCRKKSNVSWSSQEVGMPSGRGTSKKRGTGGKRNKEVVAVVPKDTIEVNSGVNSEAEDAVVNPSGLRRSMRKRHNSNKKILSSEPIPKRTLVAQKEVESESADLAEGLVGKRVKVWWPIDKDYYEGVVSSYDAAKKKHVVSYIDGDREVLNLKREKWQLVESDLDSVEGESTDLVKLEDSTPIIGLLKNDKRKKLIQKKQAKNEKFESPSKRKAKSVQKNNAKTDSSSSVEQSDEGNQIETGSSPERVEKADNETSPGRAVVTESEFGTEECANKLIALSEGVVENKKPKPISEPEKKNK